MKRIPICALVVLAFAHTILAVTILAATEGRAEQSSPGPFTTTLSNNTPLAFGMSADEAAAALGSPLTYIGGRAGNKIFLAIRLNGGSGFFPRKDQLYLQFRKGQLTGWKGDWGRRWMWQ